MTASHPTDRRPGTTADGHGHLLEVSDAVVSYWRADTGPVRAVAGVDLTVAPGEILGLVGETGCGKSSLARAIVGLVPLESGGIRFDGRPVGSLRRSSRPAGLRRLQMIFQDPSSSLNPRIRVGRQIENAVTLATGSRDAATQAKELLDQVGLPPTAAERFPHEFSGGQRQRISIARALAAKPRMIVADEPIAALDASAQAQIANLLVDLCRQLGLSLVFISHDLSIVRKIADNTAVMYLGRIVEKAPTGALWTSPLHPYTRALTGAVPKVDSASGLPAELPGDVPDPASPPPGCRFHPRCPLVVDRCRTEDPGATTLPGRVVYCWRADLPAPAGPAEAGGSTAAGDPVDADGGVD
jgi:peptide/nickel transport system ATP-binding protein